MSIRQCCHFQLLAYIWVLMFWLKARKLLNSFKSSSESGLQITSNLYVTLNRLML